MFATTVIVMIHVVFARAVGTADARRAKRAAGATWRATAARSANTRTGRIIIASVVRRCRPGNGGVAAAAVNNRRNLRRRRSRRTSQQRRPVHRQRRRVHQRRQNRLQCLEHCPQMSQRRRTPTECCHLGVVSSATTESTAGSRTLSPYVPKTDDTH